MILWIGCSMTATTMLAEGVEENQIVADPDVVEIEDQYEDQTQSSDDALIEDKNVVVETDGVIRMLGVRNDVAPTLSIEELDDPVFSEGVIRMLGVRNETNTIDIS